jgi:predicted ester cyclase
MNNRDVVESLISAIDDGDESQVRTLLAPEIVSHGAFGDVEGPDGFVGIMLHNVRTGFPDAHVDLVELVEEGDMISFRLAGHGTHLGSFLGLEPTGRTVRIGGIHLVRVRNQRIAEHWQGPDILAMLIDMGAFPPGR